MNIVFIGFASCGKSATALEIARRQKLHFIDIDREIENRYSRTHGFSGHYREMIAREGMQFFRDMECAVLSGIAPDDCAVIAPGGGAPMSEATRSVLKKLGIIVYLRTDPAVLFERMQTKGLPLFLRDDPSPEHLERLWNERHAVYLQLADYTVDNTNLSISQTADSVMAALRKGGCPAAV
jgi:shikimate kinase